MTLITPLASFSRCRHKPSAYKNCSVFQYERFYWPHTTNSRGSANRLFSSFSLKSACYYFFLAPTHVIVFLRGFLKGPPDMILFLENFCFQCPADSGMIFTPN
jgi:hypothetical protein